MACQDNYGTATDCLRLRHTQLISPRQLEQMLSVLHFPLLRRPRSQREGDAAGGWDAEWVRAYSRYEEARRAREEEEHERLFGGYAQRAQRARRGDPLGYYELMGLEPGCTTQEVQARLLTCFSSPSGMHQRIS